MTANKIICLSIILVVAHFLTGQQESANKLNGDSLCVDYILNFKPKYSDDNGDSLVVARFPDPSPALRYYIEESIKVSDFSCLKYASVVIIKLTNEHSEINNNTYLLDEKARENPFIKIVLEYISTKEQLDGDIFYFELSQWLYKHRSEIKGYKKTKRKYLK